MNEKETKIFVSFYQFLMYNNESRGELMKIEDMEFLSNKIKDISLLKEIIITLDCMTYEEKIKIFEELKNWVCQEKCVSNLKLTKKQVIQVCDYFLQCH